MPTDAPVLEEVEAEPQIEPTEVEDDSDEEAGGGDVEDLIEQAVTLLREADSHPFASAEYDAGVTAALPVLLQVADAIAQNPDAVDDDLAQMVARSIRSLQIYLSSTGWDRAKALEEEIAAQTSGELPPSGMAARAKAYATDTAVITAPDAPARIAGNGRWGGVIGMEGERTGDGRIIQPGALRWPEDIGENPIPLRYVSSDVGAHDGAVVVGLCDHIERRDGGVIWGEGPFDLDGDVGKEAYRQVKGKYTNGVSMDLDDVSFEVEVPTELADEGEGVSAEELIEQMMGSETMSTTDARVRAVTIVAIPAFANARIFALDGPEDALDDNPDILPGNDVLAARFRGSKLHPANKLAGAGIGQKRIPKGNTAGGEWMDTAEGVIGRLESISPDFDMQQEVQDAFDEAENSTAKYDPGNPLRQIAREIEQVAPETTEPEVYEEMGNALRTAASALDSKAHDKNREAGDLFPRGWEDAKDAAHVTPLAALMASAAPVAPPESWFRVLEPSGPTPLVVTDDGQVYGHLATWDACHIASPNGAGVCVMAPRSRRGYNDFHTGTLKTKEGNLISTGRLTLDTRHAGPKLNAVSAAAHYDHTGKAVADVRAIDGKHGIWVCGALRPGVTEETKRILRASPLSGDWRSIGGSLELVAALAVNVPGFPIPRPSGLVASISPMDFTDDGELLSLVAAGMIPPKQVIKPGTPGALSNTDLKYLKRLAERERAIETETLANRVAKVKLAKASKENAAKVAAMAAKIKKEN
jgi:hypothetical protein